MKILRYLFIVLPLACFGQVESNAGVKFVRNLDWQQIQTKAKLEHRYIFIDFYATWCAPCKKMDNEVYPVPSVGKLLNETFVSLKVQVDTSKNDDQQVKSWYMQARQLRDRYQIVAMPTYLFFSPEGELIHEAMGFMSPEDFTEVIKNSLDPEKQYFTVRKKYEKGELSYREMPKLINAASAVNDRKFSDSVLHNYVNNYLLKLPTDSIYANVGRLNRIASAIRSTTDEAFKIFYGHEARVDSVAQDKNYAQNIIEAAIENDFVKKKIYKDGKPYVLIDNKVPQWAVLENDIQKNFNGFYAGKVISWAKIKYFENKKDSSNYCASVIFRVKTYGPYLKIFPSAALNKNALLNSCAWDLFLFGKDRKTLEVALQWEKEVLKSDTTNYAPYLDTYANLLYKLGRIKEAIPIEERAANTAKPENIAVEIRKNLAKMKMGLPTWK